MASYGNISRHGYSELRPRRIFDIATTGLSQLRAACEQEYAAVKRPSDPWPDAS